ncbi:XRE family transcriptional regulator [Patulibacter sp. SYSU D01012]|uniref:helix-turn-helix domain-containing protein n=1 Tax=Patulibacter sp. SYSU D01012 TaxID=2817381 RepID=UPI001B309BDD|nr:XRE family transcriptional regulator [Patulibacter sp. SYSU D01012]
MDDETAVLATAIGRRVRDERLARDWTLDGLARAAGLSRRVVVNVEQGASNPSIGTLLKLADALGVGLPTLVESPGGPPSRVTRRGEGAVLWRSDAGGRGVLVAGTQPPDVLELWDWTLCPGDRHESSAHAAGTLEVLQVHEGALRIELGDEVTLLEPGDAMAFAVDVPHAYAQAGSGPVRFSLAVFDPGVGPNGRRARRPLEPGGGTP